MLRAVLACAAAAAVAAPVVLAAREDGGEPEPESAELPRAVLGCRERAESSRPPRPRAGRDAILGPIAFYDLAAQFDPSSPERGRVGRLDAPPMKALALVRGRRVVTVSVPEDQRAWMRLFYEETAYAGGEGSHVVTFRSCRRRRLTQFPGEISVDYAAAPGEGRCARLEVRVRGRPEPIVGRPFAQGEGCAGR
jgi:hypothetical protein